MAAHSKAEAVVKQLLHAQARRRPSDTRAAPAPAAHLRCRRAPVVQAHVSAADARGQTPLHLCASHGAEKASLQLIEHGAEIDAADAEGNTPLHLAVLRKRDKARARPIAPRRSPQEEATRRFSGPPRPPASRRAVRARALRDPPAPSRALQVVLLLVQHAATITRNALGLTPRDYAFEAQTHDTLKVQELQQGFELRYDLVLHFSHTARGGVRRPGP